MNKILYRVEGFKGIIQLIRETAEAHFAVAEFLVGTQIETENNISAYPLAFLESDIDSSVEGNTESFSIALSIADRLPNDYSSDDLINLKSKTSQILDEIHYQLESASSNILVSGMNKIYYEDVNQDSLVICRAEFSLTIARYVAKDGSYYMKAPNTTVTWNDIQYKPDFVTEDELSKYSLTSHTHSDYVTTADLASTVSGITSDLSSKADATELAKYSLTGHSHSDYVTNDTLNSTVSGITSELSNKVNTSALTQYSLTSHTHSQYVTTSALTASLAGKSDTGHTHSEYATTTDLAAKANASDLANYSLTSHTHSQYATTSALTSGLAGKSDTGHTHDTRYYTQEQVDSKIAAIPTGTTTTDASVLTGGTLADARLSTNIPRFNSATITFTGTTSIAGNSFYPNGGSSFNGGSSWANRFVVNQGFIEAPSDAIIAFKDSLFTNQGSRDAGIARNASGVIEVNKGTKGTLGKLVANEIDSVTLKESGVTLSDKYEIKSSKTPVTLTDATTIIWDFSTSYNAIVTLAGARSLSISNAVAGSSGTLVVKQDATGTRTLSLPTGSKVMNGGNGAVILTSAPNSIDILSFWFDGVNYYWTLGPNFN